MQRFGKGWMGKGHGLKTALPLHRDLVSNLLCPNLDGAGDGGCNTTHPHLPKLGEGAELPNPAEPTQHLLCPSARTHLSRRQLPTGSTGHGAPKGRARAGAGLLQGQAGAGRESRYQNANAQRRLSEVAQETAILEFPNFGVFAFAALMFL